MHKTHVFLGPSLELNAAKNIAPHAYFHPPAECGDIIRLFRLQPELIVIIDGLYETTPAIWHKEILLALERGIAVWGAASMGALRAAELHQYGMQGFGQVFQEFKNGTLNDDDEVAVLHLDKGQHFSAVNDAMVNIRATCEQAQKAGLLTSAAQQQLIAHCKKKFYPYRSLTKALSYLSKEEPQEYLAFAQWLSQHGMIDVKRQDAITVLQHSNQYKQSNQPLLKQESHTLTHFLRELILFANTTPFKRQESWLPVVEQNIHTLQQRAPVEYMLFAEIVSFQQKLMLFANTEQPELNNSKLLDYIHNQNLYNPLPEFSFYKEHAVLAPLYHLICQAICLGNISTECITQKLPLLAHYYALPQETAYAQQHLLRIIILLIIAINQHQQHNTNYQISKGYLTHHLKQIKNWRQYNKAQFKQWLAAPALSRSAFINLLHTYLKAYSVQSLNASTINYYQWIQDAYTLVYE